MKWFKKNKWAIISVILLTLLIIHMLLSINNSYKQSKILEFQLKYQTDYYSDCSCG
jgi:hypothetical protein